MNNKQMAIALISTLGALLIGFFFGVMVQREACKEAIIAHHAAHYEVNPATGETKFVWNNNPK